jgi:GAF domain-containing protein
MDDQLHSLLARYIEEEQRGEKPDLEAICGGNPDLLAKLRDAVGNYQEAQRVLGRPEDGNATPLRPLAAGDGAAEPAGPPPGGEGRPWGGRGGPAFTAVAAAFGVLCVYILLRLVWAQSHFRPSVELTPQLSLSRTYARADETYGLEPGFRITSAFGLPVDSLPALYDAIDRDGERRALLTIAGPEGQASVRRQVLWVERSSFAPPAVDAELRLLADDRLVREGAAPRARIVAVERLPIRSPDELRAAATAQWGRSMQIAFEPRGEDVSLAVYTVVEWEAHRILFLVGVAFGVLGLVVVWLKPVSRSARGFALFCLLLAVFWLLRSTPHHYRFAAERHTYLFAMCLVPFATVAMLGTFTPLRLCWTPFSRYLVGAALVSSFFLVGSFALSPQEARLGLLAGSLMRPWIAVNFALLLAGQVSDLWARIRRQALDAADVQRARALRWATLFTFAPYILAINFSIGSGREFRFWIELSLLAFPILLAYSIQRGNLLQIHDLLRETLLLTSLLVVLRLAYAAVSGLAMPLAEQWYPDSAPALRAVLLGGGAMAAGPLHQAARTALRRRFGATVPRWRDLAPTLDDHRSKSSSATELASSLLTTVSTALRPSAALLLLRGPTPGSWWLAARYGPDRTGPLLEECRPLLDFFAEPARSTPLFRDDLIDDLRYRKVSDALLRGMDVLDATVVFPILRDDRLFAALSLSDRIDRRNYTRDDVGLAEHLCERIGSDLHAAIVLSRQLRRGIAARYPAAPPRIGEFTIERALGQGGMALVFLGQSNGRSAAIKVPNLRVQGTPKLLERFLRERTVLRTLQHPHIVPILDTGWTMGEPYFAMEYYARGTLHDHLNRKRPLDQGEALSFAAQIASGLAAALERGVIHRDLKPRNVFFSDDGLLKVGDFGLAQVEEASTLTSEDSVFGTPSYMAPEVLQGRPADWRSDQYALGVCLFEMLLGRRPFTGTTFQALLYQHLHETVPSPSDLRPDLQEATARLVLRMLAQSPADRYDSYAELLNALAPMQHHAAR